MPNGRRVALIASHVVQYQAPFFRLLARDPAVDLTVYFCSRAGADRYRDVEMQTDLRWDVALLDGYDHEFLRNLGFGSGYWRLMNPAIVPAVWSRRFDAVVFFLGWGTITSLLGILTCLIRGVPFLLFGDSSFPVDRRTLKGFLRRQFLRLLFRHTSAFLVSGKLNGDYYAHYGADRSRFFLVPWAVDNERFASAAAMSDTERQSLRRAMGVREDDMAIVFSAKLLPRKDPLTLLRAVARMRHRRRASIIFLGDGVLREHLEQFVREHEVRAHFAGFVNQSQLPRYYAAGDVFVLPSVLEPRGAVLNEAMACGLPLVVSDRCGSIGDIVLDGENALIFPAGDDQALATSLDLLVEDAEMRRRFARRSREIIDNWDYARGVDGLHKALDAVIGPHDHQI